MRHYVYISTAAALDDSDIEAILISSQRNNALNELTGFLIYNGRNFLQLLEGPEAALRSLMTRLARDPRHNGIVAMADVPITARSFASWDMKQLHLAEDVSARREKLAGALPDTLDSEVRRIVLNFAALN